MSSFVCMCFFFFFGGGGGARKPHSYYPFQLFWFEALAAFKVVGMPEINSP